LRHQRLKYSTYTNFRETERKKYVIDFIFFIDGQTGVDTVRQMTGRLAVWSIIRLTSTTPILYFIESSHGSLCPFITAGGISASASHVTTSAAAAACKLMTAAAIVLMHPRQSCCKQWCF